MTGELEGPALRIIRSLGGAAVRLPRVLWLAVAITWGGMIWWLSSREAGPEGGNLLGGWVSNMAHAPLFGLLTLWLAFALPREPTPLGQPWARFGLLDFRLVFWSVVLYGLLDEFHQSTVPGRDASVFDLFTDWSAAYVTLGVAAAAGRAGLREAELRRRLAKGVLICCLAGLAATFG